jgi:hypothetical protein
VVGTDDVALRYLLLVPSGQAAADASALRWKGAEVGLHIAALRAAALEATEAERAQPREMRRLALQAQADQAGTSADADAAMARLERVAEAQAITAAASATAAKAVIREFRELDRVAPGLDLALSLTGEEDVFRWRVLMHGWKNLLPELHDDLNAFAAATGQPPAVELEFAFSPEHFPYAAPFVRVVRPMFAFRTGHVTIGGSICALRLLHSFGSALTAPARRHGAADKQGLELRCVAGVGAGQHPRRHGGGRRAARPRSLQQLLLRRGGQGGFQARRAAARLGALMSERRISKRRLGTN